MEVGLGQVLESFLSRSIDQRLRAVETLERWRVEDGPRLALLLTARVAAVGGPSESRALAAVLLRKVLALSADAVAVAAAQDGTGGWRLGAALLELLRVATADDRKIAQLAADVVAEAAILTFSRGGAWPELVPLLAHWCGGSSAERAVVLRILEQVGDETERDEGKGAYGSAELLVDAREWAGDRLANQPQSEIRLNVGDRSILPGLLAFLKDHGRALHSLLAMSLSDSSDRASQDAAARVYALCASDPKVPSPLLASMGDFAPSMAEALTVSEVRSEACFHAVALAAAANPVAWVPSVGTPIALLPPMLAGVTSDPSADCLVRSAALAALMELTDAAAVSEAGATRSTTEEVAAHASACVLTLLVEMPVDEATDEWAEASDDAPPPAEGREGLLADALDACERLVLHGSVATGSIEVAVADLLRQEAWQARHAALLIHLRLAGASSVVAQRLDREADAECRASNGSASSITSALAAATGHLAHTHPRVRWSALEVWTRLISFEAFVFDELFERAFESMLHVAGSDAYGRVRQRGLLVFALVSEQQPALFANARVLRVFQEVLIPQAASVDSGIREVCAAIASRLAGSGPESGAAVDSEEIAVLWAEFLEAAQMQVGEDAEPEAEGIQWPADWR